MNAITWVGWELEKDRILKAFHPLAKKECWDERPFKDIFLAQRECQGSMLKPVKFTFAEMAAYDMMQINSLRLMFSQLRVLWETGG